MTTTPAETVVTVHVKVPDMAAELALPEQLILADRCDRCGAQALHAFAHTMHDGG